MRVRPVDLQGDMLPIYDSSQMKEGAEAVAQIAKERLLFYQGEWWEDEKLGIRIPEFLANTIKRQDISIVAKYITSYLAETQGITGITDVYVNFSNHRFLYTATLHTDEGSEKLEVSLDGLL